MANSSVLTNLIPSNVLSLQLLYSSSLLGSLLHFSISLLKCSSFLYCNLKFVEHLHEYSLNSSSGKLLISISLGFSLEFSLVPSFGAYSFASPFCFGFVCFYERHRRTVFPTLERVLCVLNCLDWPVVWAGACRSWCTTCQKEWVPGEVAWCVHASLPC